MVSEQYFCQVIPSEHDGKHECGAAIAMLLIDVGAMRNQDFRYFRIAFESDSHQGRIASAIGFVYIGSFFQ